MSSFDRYGEIFSYQNDGPPTPTNNDLILSAAGITPNEPVRPPSKFYGPQIVNSEVLPVPPVPSGHLSGCIISDSVFNICMSRRDGTGHTESTQPEGEAPSVPPAPRSRIVSTIGMVCLVLFSAYALYSVWSVIAFFTGWISSVAGWVSSVAGCGSSVVAYASSIFNPTTHPSPPWTPAPEPAPEPASMWAPTTGTPDTFRPEAVGVTTFPGVSSGVFELKEAMWKNALLSQQLVELAAVKEAKDLELIAVKEAKDLELIAVKEAKDLELIAVKEAKDLELSDVQQQLATEKYANFVGAKLRYDTTEKLNKTTGELHRMISEKHHTTQERRVLESIGAATVGVTSAYFAYQYWPLTRSITYVEFVELVCELPVSLVSGAQLALGNALPQVLTLTNLS